MNPQTLLDPATWLGLGTLLAAGLGVYLLALTLVTHRRLTHPPRRTYGWAVARGVPGDPSEMAEPRHYESWTFGRAGLEFGVWDIKGDDPGGPVIVATHGWAGSRVEMLARVPHLAAGACRVVLWDMPGCGETGGASTLGGREPLDLLSLVGIIDKPVVLFGHSFGAEVCLRAAQGSPVRVLGLILEAPYRRGVTPARNMLRIADFPSLINLPAAMGLVGLLSGQGVRARWQDLASLVPSSVPLLVLHGSADDVSPIEDGEALARAGGGEFVRIKNAGHKDVFDDEQATERVLAFLRAMQCTA